jgi:hypothetical protein
METIGKHDHTRGGAAFTAAGIRQLPNLISPEVMHALAGDRRVRMSAGCYATHSQSASVRVYAPED